MTSNSNSLLYISVSPTGDYSTSRNVAKEYLNVWKLAHPGGVITERDLVNSPIPHLDGEAIYANYVPEHEQSPSMKEKLAFRMDLIKELTQVDEILVATPLWNWSIPSVLKSYIDQIVVTGVLDDSNQGLKGKKVTFVVAQGGSYKVGTPKSGWDHATGYLEHVARALGAVDVEMILAEFTLAGVAPGMDFLIEEKARSIDEAKIAARKRAA